MHSQEQIAELRTRDEVSQKEAASKRAAEEQELCSKVSDLGRQLEVLSPPSPFTGLHGGCLVDGCPDSFLFPPWLACCHQKKVASSSSDALRRERDELKGRVAELQEELVSLVAPFFVLCLFSALHVPGPCHVMVLAKKKTQKEDARQKSQLQERVPELEEQLMEAEVSFLSVFPLCPLATRVPGA